MKLSPTANVVTSGYYSVSELVSMGLPGYPRSPKGWYGLVERENWVFREVEGRGGKTGTRREYEPSPKVLALIEQRQRGELPPVPIKAKPAKEIQYQTMQAGDGRVSMAMEQAPAPFDARRDLLEAVLRVGEYKILHNQVTKHVVEFGLEGASSWLEAAQDFPDLELRLRNMIATFKFINAAGVP